MPAYDFKCKLCGVVVEVTRPGADDSAVPCPACGAETRRVFSPVGVHFKGSGFHNTDYRKTPRSSESTLPADRVATPEGAATKEGGTTKDAAATKEAGPVCDGAGSSPSCAGCPASDA